MIEIIGTNAGLECNVLHENGQLSVKAVKKATKIKSEKDVYAALGWLAKEGKLKAIVSITLDDEFAVHDIKIIEGDRGLFIAMPSKKVLDGEYRDIAHPINSEVRERVQSEILRKYQEMLDSEETESEEEGAF